MLGMQAHAVAPCAVRCFILQRTVLGFASTSAPARRQSSRAGPKRTQRSHAEVGNREGPDCGRRPGRDGHDRAATDFRVRREYNQWVANETLEDYALRFTAKRAQMVPLRVANTALGAISFLALEAIGGAITLSYGFTNAAWRSSSLAR